MSKRAGARPTSWGKISAVAAGLVGVLTVAASVFDLVPKVVDGVGRTRAAVQGLLGGAPAALYDIDVKALPVLAHSLFNVMPSQEFLHWLWLRADNRDTEALHLVVEVEIVSGPAKEERARAAEYTVEPGQSLVRSVQPPIRLLKSDFQADERLTMVWRVSRTNQRPLKSDTLHIPVLPRNVVPWGLQSASGQAVPREFLVASLTAWVVTPAPTIEARARRILARVGVQPDEATRTRRWLQLVYDELFAEHGSVRVRAQPQPFPAPAREAIRTPARVTVDGRASALEATLLLAAYRTALGGDLRARTAMLTLPASEQAPESKVFLLAWSVDGSGWEAIEVNQANTATFEDNRHAATPKARRALEENRALGAALNARGVFVDDEQRVIALAFRRAHKHYGIRPLP